MDFFIIKCFSFKSLQKALFILGHYNVDIEAFCDAEAPSSTYLKIAEHHCSRSRILPDIRAEFDKLFHSSALRCPHCKGCEELEEPCNHKTYFCLKSEFDDQPNNGGMMELLLEENFGK